MNDFIICARSIKNGKFGNEPGTTYFLNVPQAANTIEVSHKIAGNRKNHWINTVMKEAVTGTNETGQDCGDILVYVHGYNNSQKTVLKRHRKLKKSMTAQGYKGALISFDWPSADNPLNYLEDRIDAKQTAYKLVEDCIAVFAEKQQPDCHINMHLLAHSTGAFVIREAFDDADDRPAIAAKSWSVSQIMFIAGDISSKSMKADSDKTSSLYRHCVRLTNYSNPFDSVLKLSNMKRIGVARRVGRIGMPDDIPQSAVNVNCGNYFSNEQDQIEAAGGNSHSWFIGDKLFTKDMLLTIDGDIDRDSIPTRTFANGKLHLKH